MEMISGKGCLTVHVLLAPTPAGLQVYTLFMELLLNHWYSPIHTLRLLYDLDSQPTTYIHILMIPSAHSLGLLQVGSTAITSASHKGSIDSYPSHQGQFSETIHVGKTEYG